MQDTVNLLLTLLKENKIKVDQEELNFQLQSHPSYPSLHSIRGVLDHFNIDNLAIEVPVEKEVLNQLPKSFLAQIKTDSGTDMVVALNNGSGYTLVNAKRKKRQVTTAEFQEEFTGIIVAIEKDENQEIKKSGGAYSLIGRGLLIVSGLSLISLFLFTKFDIYFSIQMLLAGFGLLISRTIIKQEQGVPTTLGDAFCGETGPKNNCDAVLSSKGATIFGPYKLSGISLVYFSGLMISAFMLWLQEADFASPFIISLFAVPITFYSVYYQYKVVKKWCMLCLTLVTLLWIQASVVLLSGTIPTFSLSTDILLITGLGFLFATTIWHFLMPNIESLEELKKEKIAYHKFKKDFELFNFFLSKSATIDTHILNDSGLLFGKENAPLKITIVTNPFCGHCKKVHTLVEDIYRKYPKKVALNIRFNIDTGDEESDGVRIASHILEFYHTAGTSMCLEAMHDIYQDQTADIWFNKWGKPEAPEQYINVLQEERDWCKNSNLNFTPAILINGKTYPNEYDRMDLIYFIEELHENCCELLDSDIADPEYAI